MRRQPGRTDGCVGTTTPAARLAWTLAALLGAALAAPPALAQDDWDDTDEEDVSEEAATPQVAEQAATVVTGVVVTPERPKRADQAQVIIRGTSTPTSSRVTNMEPPVGAAWKTAEAEAPVVRWDVAPYLGGSEHRYQGWVRGEIDILAADRPTGALVLSRLDSRLSLVCPGEATAGEIIPLAVESIGDADAEWRVSIIYPGENDTIVDAASVAPDGGRYDERKIVVGKKTGGTARIQTVAFRTYPADGEGLLGVHVENADCSEFSHTFWVQVHAPPGRAGD